MQAERRTELIADAQRSGTISGLVVVITDGTADTVQHPMRHAKGVTIFEHAIFEVWIIFMIAHLLDPPVKASAARSGAAVVD
jgi:hypothetical protein